MKRIIALIILYIGFNLCFGANTEDKDKQQPASSYQPIGVKKDSLLLEQYKYISFSQHIIKLFHFCASVLHYH